MVEAISANEFRQVIANNPDVPILDTRPRQDYLEWHIPGAISVPYKPGEPIDTNELDEAIPAGTDRILTVCGWGISSFEFAETLESQGYPPVTVLTDGMVAWSRVYDVTEVAMDAPVTCYQLQRLAKGCLGYLVSCERTGSALAIDIPIHLDEVRTLLDAEGLSLTGVVDSHIHADHVSGGPTLAEQFDVPYYIGARASDRGLQHEHEPVSRGDLIPVGTIDLHVSETPGHTSEMIALGLADGSAIFTADTLFTDGVGRTELESPQHAHERARELYQSLTEVVFEFPQDTLVLPGHFDPAIESMHQPETPVAASLEAVRESISVLDVGESAFVEAIVKQTGDRPPNYRAIQLINLGGRPLPAHEIVTQLEMGPNRCAASA